MAPPGSDSPQSDEDLTGAILSSEAQRPLPFSATSVWEQSTGIQSKPVARGHPPAASSYSCDWPLTHECALDPASKLSTGVLGVQGSELWHALLAHGQGHDE